MYFHLFETCHICDLCICYNVKKLNILAVCRFHNFSQELYITYPKLQPVLYFRAVDICNVPLILHSSLYLNTYGHVIKGNYHFTEL